MLGRTGEKRVKTDGRAARMSPQQVLPGKRGWGGATSGLPSNKNRIGSAEATDIRDSMKAVKEGERNEDIASWRSLQEKVSDASVT